MKRIILERLYLLPCFYIFEYFHCDINYYFWFFFLESKNEVVKGNISQKSIKVEKQDFKDK